MTPENVHYGRAAGSLKIVRIPYLLLMKNIPNGSNTECLKPMMLPDKAWINKPLSTSDGVYTKCFTKVSHFH